MAPNGLSCVHLSNEIEIPSSLLLRDLQRYSQETTGCSCANSKASRDWHTIRSLSKERPALLFAQEQPVVSWLYRCKSLSNKLLGISISFDRCTQLKPLGAISQRKEERRASNKFNWVHSVHLRNHRSNESLTEVVLIKIAKTIRSATKTERKGLLPCLRRKDNRGHADKARSFWIGDRFLHDQRAVNEIGQNMNTDADTCDDGAAVSYNGNSMNLGALRSEFHTGNYAKAARSVPQTRLINALE